MGIGQFKKVLALIFKFWCSIKDIIEFNNKWGNNKLNFE